MPERPRSVNRGSTPLLTETQTRAAPTDPSFSVGNADMAEDGDCRHNHVDSVLLACEASAQSASELIQHGLLAFADLHRAEAHEPAFLRGVSSRLRSHD